MSVMRGQRHKKVSKTSETMEFKIEGHEPETRPSIPPVRDFTSWRFRLRMGSLLAALLVVVLIMGEAGKPENWQWMGFPEESPAPESAEGSTAFDDSPGRNDAPEESRLGDTGPSNQTPLDVRVSDSTPPLPAKVVDFWEEHVAQIKEGAELQRLSQWVQAGASGSSTSMPGPRTESKETITEQTQRKRLLDKLVRKRNRFHDKLFDQISFMEDAARKEQLSAELHEARTFWQSKILPALQCVVDGQELTISQSMAMKQLQTLLDRLVFSQVLDLAPLNRKMEGAAWIRNWELLEPNPLGWNAQSEGPQSGSPLVSQIQLTGQPDVYRGRPIRTEGWLRRLERKTSTHTKLNLEEYYVGWFRPKDSNLMPYCFYFRDIPEQWKTKLGSGNSLDLNAFIKVEGRFFKIRSYQSAERKILSCPLIFANGFTEVQLRTASNPADSWQPGWGFWITFFVALPIVATVVAMSVYYATGNRRWRPGPSTVKRIHGDLKGLENNDEILSEAQNVAALQQKLDQDNRE